MQKRMPNEDFHHFVTRTTHKARRLFHQYGYKSAATLLLQRQHKVIGESFARLGADLESRAPHGDMASLVRHPLPAVLADGTRARVPSLSVISLALLWKSQAWWEWEQALMTTLDATNTSRWRHSKPGRQAPWESSFSKALGSKWMELAIGPEWKNSLSKFVDAAHDQIGLKTNEARYAKKPCRRCVAVVPPAKKPRLVSREPQSWADSGNRMEICGDSRVIVQWVNGVWPTRFLPYARCVQQVHRKMHGMWCQNSVRPRTDSADFFRHIYRELNTEADALANKYADSWSLEYYEAPAKHIRAFFDGSRRPSKAAFGWIVYASSANGDEISDWKPLATRSCVLPQQATITAAELEACSSLVSFLRAYYLGYTQALQTIQTQSLLDYRAVHILSLANMV